MQVNNNEALDMIKAVYDDQKATINNRDYEFTTMTFSERRKVFAFFSSVQNSITVGNFSFLEDTKFKEIEEIIFKRIKYDGHTLKKLNGHFDNFTEDYMMLITTALSVISFPFLKGGIGK